MREGKKDGREEGEGRTLACQTSSEYVHCIGFQ